MTKSLLLGLVLSAAASGYARHAAADDGITCSREFCAGETCNGIKSCQVDGNPQMNWSCGDWMRIYSWQSGVTCSPEVQSVTYGSNWQCTSSGNYHQTELSDQTDAVANLASPLQYWTYQIPWPSYAQDPCFGVAKTLVANWMCGLKPMYSLIPAEAANKQLTIYCD